MDNDINISLIVRTTTFTFTIAETINYSKLVSIILKEVNKFRENPMMLSPLLEHRSHKYHEKVYYPQSDHHIQIETQEGVQPVHELISLIKMNNVFPKLNWSYELHCAANQRAEAIASDYIQTETEQLPVEHLVSAFANWSGNLSEHVLYGFCDPMEILCELLIDDGNHERGK